MNKADQDLFESFLNWKSIVSKFTNKKGQKTKSGEQKATSIYNRVQHAQDKLGATSASTINDLDAPAVYRKAVSGKELSPDTQKAYKSLGVIRDNKFGSKDNLQTAANKASLDKKAKVRSVYSKSYQSMTKDQRKIESVNEDANFNINYDFIVEQFLVERLKKAEKYKKKLRDPKEDKALAVSNKERHHGILTPDKENLTSKGLSKASSTLGRIALKAMDVDKDVKSKVRDAVSVGREAIRHRHTSDSSLQDSPAVVKADQEKRMKEPNYMTDSPSWAKKSLDTPVAKQQHSPTAYKPIEGKDYHTKPPAGYTGNVQHTDADKHIKNITHIDTNDPSSSSGSGSKDFLLKHLITPVSKEYQVHNPGNPESSTRDRPLDVSVEQPSRAAEKPPYYVGNGIPKDKASKPATGKLVSRELPRIGKDKWASGAGPTLPKKLK